MGGRGALWGGMPPAAWLSSSPPCLLRLCLQLIVLDALSLFMSCAGEISMLQSVAMSATLEEPSPLDGGPATSSAEHLGKKSGPKPQYNHVQTLKRLLQEFKETHSNCRFFAAMQSAYSNDIHFLVMHNLGAHVSDLKTAFVEACAQPAGRLVTTAKLREDLAQLTDSTLIAKAADLLVELFQAEGLIGPKLAEMMLSCIYADTKPNAGELVKWLIQVKRLVFCCFCNLQCAYYKQHGGGVSGSLL